MKMLTVSALLCAMLVLTRATSPAEAEEEPGKEGPAKSIPAPKEGEPEPWEPVPPSIDTPALHAEGEPEPWEPVPPSIDTPALHDDFGFDHFHFSCPDGWTMFDIHCLLYVPENMTWADAEHNCQSGNGNFNGYGNLASVFEEYHFDDILKVMKAAGHKSGQVWLGGSKGPGASSWSWSDDMSPNTFPNWCSGEPSKENCLISKFEEKAPGCLEGSPCDAELPSVCSILLM